MNSTIQHPSTTLHPALLTTLREHSGLAEQAGMLTSSELDLIVSEKWLKMFVPKKHGGLELTLPEVLKIEESLSWADGSIGWVVTLCSGAGWFIGFIDPSVADEIFNDNTMCIAGSGALTGTAEIVDGGYEVNGIWKYASGALHATAFTMNCYITKNRQQLYNDDGSPMQSSFIVKRSHIKLHKTWNSMGMVATGTHSFEVNSVFVPSRYAFTIHPDHAALTNSIYRYPFLSLAETTLAVNLSGMAVCFIDLAEEIITENAAIISAAKKILHTSRQHFFNEIEKSWNEVVEKNTLSSSSQLRVTDASQSLVQQSKKVVSILFPYCGLAAADRTSKINAVWRNFYTAGQHALFKKESL